VSGRIAQGLARLEAGLSSGFGHAGNPMHYLGALATGFLWMTLVTGIYLFVFYRTSLEGAYLSVEALTREQWFAGGVMRSVHRYASDAAMVCLLAHALREALRGRFRGPRWFSWVSGTPLFWILILFGITGYWMVWDEMGLYAAQASAALLDALPIFAEPMLASFLTAEAVSSRLFTLIAFIHLVGLPLLIVIAIWLHLMRVRYPRLNPPRRLWVASLVALLILSLLLPVTSHGPADLSQVPGPLRLDWFYLGLLPLAEWTSPSWLWAIGASTTLVVAALPLVPGGINKPPARVYLPDCSGCSYCAEDCPYGAIDMVARSDGRNFELEARIDTALCVSCGICAGSCPSSSPFRQRDPLTTGIELPDWSMQRLRAELRLAQASQQCTEVNAPDPVLVIGCDHGVDLARLPDSGVQRISLPCIGMLPASALDYALRQHAFRGVLISSCAECDCYHRLGDRWLVERIDRDRPPALRERVERSRIAIHPLKQGQQRELQQALVEFRRALERSQDATDPGARP